eukprot:366552-Chlamydomonas_euryale.AAC.3
MAATRALFASAPSPDMSMRHLSYSVLFSEPSAYERVLKAFLVGWVGLTRVGLGEVWTARSPRVERARQRPARVSARPTIEAHGHDAGSADPCSRQERSARNRRSRCLSYGLQMAAAAGGYAHVAMPGT